MRVLITGSAGVIGTILVEGLRERHQLRGFDRVRTRGIEDVVVANIGNARAVRKAAAGMDAIIHLVNAGGDWKSCQQNMTGIHNILEAAHHQGVRRIVYASRARLHPPVPRYTVDLPTRPRNFYHLSKAFAENIGYMYTISHGLEFVAVRVGNVRAHRDAPEHPRHLSHGDCVRCFEQAVTHPDVGFEIVYGVSNSESSPFDLEHGRQAIGYYPQDWFSGESG